MYGECVCNAYIICIHLLFYTFRLLWECERAFVCTNNCMIEYLKKSNESDIHTQTHATLPPVDCVCCTTGRERESEKKTKSKQQETQTAKFATQLKCEIWIFIGEQHIEKHKHKNAINILGIHLVVIAFVCNRLNCFFGSFLGARMRLFAVHSFYLHLRLHHKMYIVWSVRFAFELYLPM